MSGKETQVITGARSVGAPAGPQRVVAVDGASIRRERVIFLGGLLLESQIDEIERQTRTGVQYAADALQRAMLKGLSLHSGIDLHLVNVPFVGSYPKTYRKLWFPAIKDILFGTVPVHGEGFFNLLVAQDHSRRRAAYRGLVPLVEGAGPCVIMIYSAHLPFIKAALACQAINPEVRICIVVPDFIEHMGEPKSLRKLLIQREGRIFRRLARQIDYFVVLTHHMATELGIGPEKHVVIEGIHDPDPFVQSQDWPSEPGPVFIYTGTLAARYGILDLLQAFSQIETPTARLWICGSGDMQKAVEELALRDPRVTFHGRVPRAEAVALQARAHVMVNPRRPEGEFTRFSFPSKTMEYLASGRPVIMHWLPGIPEEYRPHLITPRTGDADGLAEAMQQVAALPQDELRRLGDSGRTFILTYKTPQRQVGKVLAGLFPGKSFASAGND